MDSRLILAAWPESEPLPCYSYGPPEFADVAFARASAAIRGSMFTRIPLEGDEVAAGIDEMARLCGPPSFPHRYLAARRISAGGLDTVLDGYAGMPASGAEATMALADSCRDRLGGRSSAIDSATAGSPRFRSTTGGEPCPIRGGSRHGGVARSLFQSRHRPAPGFGEAGNAPRRLDGVARVAPSDGSVAVAVRDFKLTQRALHSTIHQGVLCRRFVRVAYPLFCDVPLLEALWTIAPRHIAYRRLYVRLFRRHFPAYAEVPYAASLLALKRSPLLHRWAKVLRSRGVRLPFTRRARVNETYNEWDTWLRESPALRERAIALLTEVGIGERSRLRTAIERIGKCYEVGSGDLLHVGALAYLVEPLTLRRQNSNSFTNAE